MAGKKTPKKSPNLKKPWKPGQSGNPNGRPKGARNKTTIAIEDLLDGQAKALTQKAVDKALEGDMQALRLCLDRICPPRKDRPISLELPKVETIPDIVTAIGVILEAVAAGDITPSEGTALAGLLETKRKAIETEEIERRIRHLEEAT
jgi:hypothetical protein